MLWRAYNSACAAAIALARSRSIGVRAILALACWPRLSPLVALPPASQTIDPLHHDEHPGLGLLDVLVPLFERKTG